MTNSKEMTTYVLLDCVLNRLHIVKAHLSAEADQQYLDHAMQLIRATIELNEEGITKESKHFVKCFMLHDELMDTMCDVLLYLIASSTNEPLQHRLEVLIAKARKL